MKHLFLFRYKWAPKDDSQWPFYSFLARLDKTENLLVVPYMIENDDGSIEDPHNLRRFVAITELTQIGSQSVPALTHAVNGEEVKVSVYTQDIYNARTTPLLEGGVLEVIFEDEIVNQGNVFGTRVDPMWLEVLQLNIDEREKVRGYEEHAAPLIRYHGTSKEAYASILREGLRPTTRLGMMGNGLQYVGHYAKALRYSYIDSGRETGIRENPILLRYALFITTDEVLRPVKQGVIQTREITKEEYQHIPERNQWLLNSDDMRKDFALFLYQKGLEIGSTDVGFTTVMDREPYETLEEARVSLLIGDQTIRTDPTTYFTGKEGYRMIAGEKVAIPEGGWKAYEVDGFWVPVKDPSMPGGIRYYSFTKYPEMAVVPAPGRTRLVGSFQPNKVTSGTYPEQWERDPLLLVSQLRAGRRAIHFYGLDD